MALQSNTRDAVRNLAERSQGELEIDSLADPLYAARVVAVRRPEGIFKLSVAGFVQFHLPGVPKAVIYREGTHRHTPGSGEMTHVERPSDIAIFDRPISLDNEVEAQKATALGKIGVLVRALL